MIHIAICDDEKDFVAHLTGLLDQYSFETGEEIRVTPYYDGLEGYKYQAVDYMIKPI